MKLTFEQWKKKVDEALELRAGLSSDDLPDVCWWDWFDDCISPESAARRALLNAEVES